MGLFSYRVDPLLSAILILAAASAGWITGGIWW